MPKTANHFAKTGRRTARRPRRGTAYLLVLGAGILLSVIGFGIMTASRVWDNGFRHVTSSTRPIRTPEDLHGFKIRVPPAAILTSLFKALDAGPSPINFNELYSALQTRVVEGQENPLAIIATTRLKAASSGLMNMTASRDFWKSRAPIRSFRTGSVRAYSRLNLARLKRLPVNGP